MSKPFVLSFNQDTKQPIFIEFEQWKEQIGIKYFNLNSDSPFDELNKIKLISPDLQISSKFANLNCCDGISQSHGRINNDIEDVVMAFDNADIYDVNEGTVHSVDVYTFGDKIINISYIGETSINYIEFYSERILVTSFGAAYRDQYPMGLNLVMLSDTPVNL